MLKKINVENETVAFIIHSGYRQDGIKFFTSDKDQMQLGAMERPKGYVIQPHIHNIVERQINTTSEVLFIRFGKVKVNFYNKMKKIDKSVILKTGDVILLITGAHGFEILEDCQMVEVKQGPYLGEMDKTMLTNNE